MTEAYTGKLNKYMYTNLGTKSEESSLQFTYQH